MYLLTIPEGHVELYRSYLIYFILVTVISFKCHNATLSKTGFNQVNLEP